MAVLFALMSGVLTRLSGTGKRRSASGQTTKKPHDVGFFVEKNMNESKACPAMDVAAATPQTRCGVRLRSRSSSGQADKIAVVFILENSCDAPTTRSLGAWLTAKRKKMQPDHPLIQWKFQPQN
jgi:hypothetical protein